MLVMQIFCRVGQHMNLRFTVLRAGRRLTPQAGKLFSWLRSWATAKPAKRAAATAKLFIVERGIDGQLTIDGCVDALVMRMDQPGVKVL